MSNPTAVPPARHEEPGWRASMRVRLDFNLMLADSIGPAYGLRPEEIWGMQGRIDEAHRLIESRTGKGSDFLGFLDLPYQDDETLARIQATADRLAGLGDRHIVLGIGGSYLGARAVIDALMHPYRNELTREDRGGRPKVYYEGNNVDADALGALLDMLPKARPADLAHAFTLNIISKSGTTLETAVATRLLLQRVEEVYGSDHAHYVVATTDGRKGTLKEIADAEGYPSFVIPDNVGGRYSVLTPVGLLPAAVAGVDIRALVAGARDMAERCRSASLRENPAYAYAALQYLSAEAGRDVSIMAAWSKRLEFLTFWYDQLSAESLGKEERGRIPVSTVNTRDLHSRGQEIQEGPRSQVVTNLVIEAPDRDVSVPAIEGDPDGLNYLAGKSLGHMALGAAAGTAFAYARAGRPSMTVRIPHLNAFTLGQLIYMFELATLAEGHLMGINPLDQPGVEEYKKFMFGNLGRPDMAAYRAEFEARPQPSEEFVV